MAHNELVNQVLSQSPPSSDYAMPGPSVDFDRFRLFDAITHVVGDVARQRALIVVLDDIHCADTASHRLLAYMATELTDLPLFLITTYRPANCTFENLFDHLPSDRVALLDLIGLNPSDIQQLVSNATGVDIDDATAEMLYLHTFGNPFLLNQLSSLPNFGSALRDDRALPPLTAGIRQAVIADLRRLPPSTWGALQMATVFGREVPVYHLADALGRDPASLLEELEPALARSVLVQRTNAREPVVEFRHLLLRDAIYDTIPAAERLAAHGRTALTLEKLSTSHAPAEIAFHFLNAHLPRRAISYLEAAGESAAAHLAYEDAAEYFQAALQTLESSGVSSPCRSADLLIRLGDAQLRSGRRGAARQTLLRATSVARSVNAGLLFSRAVLSLAPDLLSIEMGVLDTSLIDLLQEALARIPASNTAYRSRLHARLSMALLWAHRREERTKHSLEAYRLAEQSGDEVSLAHALLARHRSCWGPHSPHERLKIANELSAVAERAAVRRLRPLATLFRITSLLELARVGDVDTEIQRMVGLAEELRDPYTQWQVLLLRSTRALMEGRFEDARSLGEDFLARGNRVGDENAPHSFGAQLAIQLWESDRVEDTVRACREFVRDFPHVPVWRASLMFFLVEADRLDEARREFMTLTARGLGDIVQDENWRATLMLIGDVAATIGKLEIAEQVYEELQVFHGTMVLSAHAVVVAGLQDHRLGILAAALGRFEAAARHFEHALALGKKAGAIPWLAHAQYSYAKMLLKQGSRANRSYAQELITCAGEITRAFGMVRLQKRVSALS